MIFPTELALLLPFLPFILAYSGDMTYYDPSVGLTSCGTLHGPNELIVALSTGMMNNGGNPNSNPKCGKTIGIWNPQTKQQHYATVVDTCYGCQVSKILGNSHPLSLSRSLRSVSAASALSNVPHNSSFELHRALLTSVS